MREPCVYFVKHNAIDPIKIGYTTDIEKRLTHLAVSSPFGLTLVGTIISDDAQAIEKELHLRFSQYRLKGEWFEITRAQVEAAIKTYDDLYYDKIQKAILFLEERHLEMDENKRKESLDFVSTVVSFIDSHGGPIEKSTAIQILMESTNVSKMTMYNKIKKHQAALNRQIKMFKRGKTVFWALKEKEGVTA
jgi:hypothetical protein